MSNPKKHGFTIVEMSIIIVIIGFLLGGIYIGRDLIRSARVRAQISQFESYNLAVNLFRQKYDELPGDIQASVAAKYGFTARSGANGHGDGDGLFESCDPLSFGEIPLGCEVILFWSDLSKAKLIPEQFTAATDAYMAAANHNDTFNYLPKAKISEVGSILISNHLQQGYGWFVINYIGSTIPLGNTSTSGGMSVVNAYNIDSKLDDGDPLRGNVIVTSFVPGFGANSGPFFATVAQNINNCVFNNGYSLTAANVTINHDYICQVNIRMQY